jgi:hypothetical protein
VCVDVKKKKMQINFDYGSTNPSFNALESPSQKGFLFFVCLFFFVFFFCGGGPIIGRTTMLERSVTPDLVVLLTIVFPSFGALHE